MLFFCQFFHSNCKSEWELLVQTVFSTFVVHSFLYFFPFSTVLLFFLLCILIFSFNYCHFVYWLYVLLCMVPLCTASLSLLFGSFRLGPACRDLLFILALKFKKDLFAIEFTARDSTLRIRISSINYPYAVRSYIGP